MALVFKDQTSNGDSLFYPGVNNDPYKPTATFKGGKAHIAIQGNLDGGIVTVWIDQGGPTDAVSWIQLKKDDGSGDPLELAFEDINEISPAKADRIKLVLSDAGAGTNITASIVNV